MAILDSLQRHLDTGFNRDLNSLNGLAMDNMDSDDPSDADMTAFTQAMMKASSSSNAANVELQMKHNLTKSIIEGAS